MTFRAPGAVRLFAPLVRFKERYPERVQPGAELHLGLQTHRSIA